LEPGTALALLFEQRAFGDERVRIIHKFVGANASRFRGDFIGFEFGAAELSLEKFRNALNSVCLFVGRRAGTGRGNYNRQKDELVNHSRWPARALPSSNKVVR